MPFAPHHLGAQLLLYVLVLLVVALHLGRAPREPRHSAAAAKPVVPAHVQWGGAARRDQEGSCPAEMWTFVVAYAASVGSLVSAAQTEKPLVTDVVIVGAGWAGMAAADSLARANVSFVVLESTNRTGGRSHSLPSFGDPEIWQGVVERGSNWVSGVSPPGTNNRGGAAGVAKHMTHLPAENPVHLLARQENLSMVRIPGAADGNMSLYEKIYCANGTGLDCDPDGKIRSAANEALDCLNRSSPKADISTTVRQGLLDCNWRPESAAQWAMDWAMSGEDANGEPARNQSLADWGPDTTYQFWGPDDQFVIDQHPRGFARLIDGMVRDTIPPGDPRIMFDAKVTKMQYDCNGVLVTTENGRTVQAREVISTLPLGVLQRQHHELFEPKLPQKHRQILDSDKIQMGNLTHVVVQFPTVWWDDSLAKWLQANTAGGTGTDGKPQPNDGSYAAKLAASGEFSLWYDVDKF